MSSESLTPQPPTSGGSAKYIVLLLLLLGGGLGVYLATSGDEPEPAPKPEVKSVERPTSLADDSLNIPDEEEEDAAVAPAEETATVKKPRPATDVWTCDGNIAASDLSRVIGQGQTAVRSCYERALRNDNQLQGQVRLGIRIGADGKVTHTRVVRDLRDPEVSKCIQGLARQWVFPAPGKGNCVAFEQPFTLTPKN